MVGQTSRLVKIPSKDRQSDTLHEISSDKGNASTSGFICQQQTWNTVPASSPVQPYKMACFIVPSSSSNSFKCLKHLFSPDAKHVLFVNWQCSVLHRHLTPSAIASTNTCTSLCSYALARTHKPTLIN